MGEMLADSGSEHQGSSYKDGLGLLGQKKKKRCPSCRVTGNFERRAQISALPINELQEGVRLGLDDAFHRHRADGYRNTLCVRIHTDISSAGHKRALFSGDV